MLIAPLPFDYATLLDTGDRVRRARRADQGTKVRVRSARRKA